MESGRCKGGEMEGVAYKVERRGCFQSAGKDKTERGNNKKSVSLVAIHFFRSYAVIFVTYLEVLFRSYAIGLTS